MSIVAPPVQNLEDAGTRVVYAGVTVTHAAPALLPGALDWSTALLRLALAERPDVLHLFKPKGYGGLAALLARYIKPDLPLVLDTDDWEGWGGWNDLLPYPKPAKQLFAWQERDLPRRAAAVTVASRTLQTQVWGFGVEPQRVVYLPNGLTISDQPSADDAISHERNRQSSIVNQTIVLYTRFWEFDLRDLVAALVAIAQNEAQARLIVIGKGERGEERTLLQLAERAGIASTIDYRGWMQPEAIAPLLASASIALVPLDDTLINRARCSAKLLELMQAGLAVVGSDVGQMREYITHESSGLLVPPGSPGALAAATLRLLHDEKLRTKLVVGAQAALERFSWDRLAVAAEEAYRIVLD